MSNISYFHSIGQRKSYAIELPPKNLLFALINNFWEDIIVNFGVASVHPKDNFNKTIGREVAKGKIERNKFELLRVEMYFDRLIFCFYTLHEGIAYYIDMSIVKHSNNVHIEEISC